MLRSDDENYNLSERKSSILSGRKNIFCIGVLLKSCIFLLSFVKHRAKKLWAI